ncbi:uncharacterized protein LOC114465598 [Gouania willdenowi]|uniref:uncharacterized protein LOC114465598 n=1 Tax=Gouania willdenowi TaxID=441366 RepID=UPI00105457F9|nr:uncharacterized protein LOC114465598 [Gouania willdenowi]
MAQFEERPWTVLSSLLLVLSLHAVTGSSGWAGCFHGQDVFATIRENSPSGERVADVKVDTEVDGVHWSLNGKDADWLYLEDGTIRLNTSADKIFDRETLGPVLMAQLSCYEEDVPQSVYRIVVEIIDENDNKPVFAEDTVQYFTISELTAVNTVAFKVQATDADNDKILYSIDRTSPDAEHFRIDLPNSGEVILAKALDYETKTQLTVTIYASEMNTAEHFNISTNISIDVLDGDDQYPQFVPCTLLYQDENNRVCINPVYMANVTEGEEDVVLDFSPGFIHAVDGDRGLRSPVKYRIISGDDDGRFKMDAETGEVRLTHAVTDRIITPSLQLTIMAYQQDDPRKYSVATAEVRVLSVNQFHPEFDAAEYYGFVAAGNSPASLVKTYGGKALILRVDDQDFEYGFNPMIYFSFSPLSNHSDLYRVTEEGLVIAKLRQIKAKQIHVLEVMAVDKETSETTFATVVVEVLFYGQSAPHSPRTDEQVIGCTVGKALVLATVFTSALGGVLWTAMWLKRKHKGSRGPLERGCVAQGKHPNVSLRWFQLVSHRCAMPHMDEVSHKNEEYGTYNPSFSFCSQDEVLSSRNVVSTRTSFVCTEMLRGSVSFNNSQSTPNKVAFSSLDRDGSHTHGAQEEKFASPPPSPSIHDTSVTPPLFCPGMEETSNDDVTSPSSQASVSCCNSRLASAEIDKPFSVPRARTPVGTPLLSPPFLMVVNTPSSTPEHAPLKATLVTIYTTPPDTPPITPTDTQSIDANQPSTSLDHIDDPECSDDASLDRRASTMSENDHEVAEEEEEGILGDEDANKNSESELESDEEELLRVMARCNPIFITFSK